MAFELGGKRLLSRWLTGAFGLIAILLVPWTLWLTFTLPTRHVTSHYDVAWVGFDVGLSAAFAATAIAGLRASAWLQALAALTGTMLLCDAWFDTLTATSGKEQLLAILEAVGAELPLAALCWWIVADTTRFQEAVTRWYLTTSRGDPAPPPLD